VSDQGLQQMTEPTPAVPGPGLDAAADPIRKDTLARAWELRRLVPSNAGGALLALVVLFIVLSFSSSAFLTSGNLLNVLNQNAEIGIIACGMTLLIICGNLDFSVAATYGLTSIVVAGLATHIGIVGAIALALAVGAVIGLVNAFLVVTLGIDSFICTLASGFIVAGLTEVITKGNLVTSADTTLGNLGTDTFLKATYNSWVFVVVAVALSIFMAKTARGQNMYAVGDNPEAARLSGLRVKLIVMTAFLVAGLCAAIGGTLIAATTSAGQPQDGLDLVVAALAAVVIGGTSVRGGTGSIWRTVVGVLLLGLIGNGLTLINVNPVYQEIIEGAIILIAVAFERLQRTRTG
jgi:ribose transport system permease protein